MKRFESVLILTLNLIKVLGANIFNFTPEEKTQSTDEAL